MQVSLDRLVSAGFDFLPFLIGWSLLVTTMLIILRRFIHKKPRGKGTVIAGNVLVFLLFFLISLVPFEIYFRYSYDATDTLSFLQTATRWRARHVAINNQGFRDDNFSGLKKPGVVRIGVLGDSFTYGQGIERREDLYVDILERSLSRKMPVEIYNISRDGLTTRDQLGILLDERNPVAQYDFDLLILAYVLNDFRGDTFLPLLRTEATYRNIRLFPGLKQFFDHSLALEFFTFHLIPYLPQIRDEEEQGAISAYNDPIIWAEHRKTLATLIAFSRKTKTPLTIMLLPHMQHINDYPAIGTHEKLRAFFSANRLPVLDMLETFQGMNPPELMVNRMDAHPNEEAHKIIATRLETYLLEQNLIQARKKSPSESTKAPLRKIAFAEQFTPPNKLLMVDESVLFLDGLFQQDASCLSSLNTREIIDSPRKIASEDRNGKVEAWTVREDNEAKNDVNLNQKILELGLSIPDLEEASKEKAIEPFIRMWRARMFNRGLWRTCSWEALKTLWGFDG